MASMGRVLSMMGLSSQAKRSSQRKAAGKPACSVRAKANLHQAPGLLSQHRLEAGTVVSAGTCGVHQSYSVSQLAGF
jgi:hypothetical protein